jgi:hypothetical protein
MKRGLYLALLAAALAIAAEPVHVIPISVRDGNIFISTRLADSGPWQFEFDSAAAGHVVNRRLADDLKLKIHSIVTAQGAGDGSTQAAFLADTALSLEGLELPPSSLAAIDLDPVSDRKAYRLDGLIGTDLMRHWVVECDYAASLMRLYDPATWRYRGLGESLPLRTDSMGKAYVTTEVHIPGREPVKADFLIDSAAGPGTAVFTSPFALKHDMVAAVRRAGLPVLTDEIMGVGGTSVSWITRVDAIKIGRTTLRRPVVTITGAKGGTLARSDIAGLIGGALLSRFRVIYDLPHAHLYLEPGNRIEAPFEDDMAGIRWVAYTPDRTRFRVRDLIPGSPATQAGVAVGDNLLAVDDRTAGSFDRQWLREALRVEGRHVHLIFDRQGTTREVTIVLRRLV